MTIEIFDKHPEADAYRVGGFYSPYCLVSKDKRFSDAELAAEWQHARFTQLSDQSFDRTDIIRRFATLPHFDA